MDFITDRLANGGSFRVLTVVDQFSRECPLLAAGLSLTGKRVVDCLEQLALFRGLPDAITVDNGAEFCSKALDAWAYKHGVKLCFIRRASRWKIDSSRTSTGSCATNVRTRRSFLRWKILDRN